MNRKEFIQATSLGTAAFFFLGMGSFFGKSPNPLEEELRKPFEMIDKNVVIIGSGYGGSVAALRLCEKNIPVTLLEMGLDWEKSGQKFSSMINPGHSAAWLKTKTIAPFFNLFSLEKYTGALDRLDFEHIKIWLGRGVGGGSLVNGGMAVTPKKEYFKEVFPNLDAEKFYSKYFPLANKELKSNVASEEFLKDCSFYKFNRVGEEEAKKAGFKTVRVPNVYDFNYMEKEYKEEVPRSAFAGEVIYGNNHGKNSLDKTYLKKASATGKLEILELHQVNHITQNPDQSYSIDISVINTKGEEIQHKIINTKKLILSAGTMGSLELLLKSKAMKQLPMDDKIGKDWGNNGNFMTGRNWVKAFSGGTGFQQSTIPVGGIDHWEDKDRPFFVEIAPLPMGLNVATSLYLMVNKLKKYGEVNYDSVTQKLQLNWDQSHTAHMKDNAKYFLRTMNKANGGTRAHLLFHNGFGADVCYHPLGGIVLGKATDNYGRLNGHKNLYVIDGSLIPGTIGVNPFVTITAIAEYCMEEIIEKDFA
ncbi:GMC family oxidoreductase N-terminal domain-containing protein [Kaistella jeonii]|uniref:Cholesterol oxidase n=1 Tax=Kaistella jeonii TaxID=266749 RepID=A0A0C1F6G7_9FLAO|nr:GMC oxidoreductase [Kaistella jeonii]KIA88787.1 cholesterol oxidase [Kaistella jeonii]SFC14803.1 cholesterol oxidase [Kaistella jeonii]VEI97418.1 Cholesterol oxidase precursor [Kaistella jeonii]